METLKKAGKWLVTSSADPDKLALSVKAGLPFLILALSMGGLKLEEGDALAAVHAFAVTVTGLATLYGACRKVYLNLK